MILCTVQGHVDNRDQVPATVWLRDIHEVWRANCGCNVEDWWDDKPAAPDEQLPIDQRPSPREWRAQNGDIIHLSELE